MNAKWTEGFIQDFSSLDHDKQQKVVEKVEKLENKGTEIDEVGLASNKETGVEAWKLKIKDEDIDQRIIFDIIDASAVFIALGHRDDIYDNKKWRKVAERLREF